MRIDDDYMLINYEYNDDKVNYYSISLIEIDRLCNEIDILNEYFDKNNKVNIMNDNYIYPEEYLNNTDRRIQLYDKSYYIHFNMMVIMVNLINIINLIIYIQFIALNSNSLINNLYDV